MNSQKCIKCILSAHKENVSYTYLNTPPPPLYNVQIEEVFL
jgi:hypothetical protein